jgi:hypothetical protein
MRSIRVAAEDVVDPGSFPMEGFACNSCDIWCRLDNNAHYHEHKNAGHKMEPAIIYLEDKPMVQATSKEKTVLEKVRGCLEDILKQPVDKCHRNYGVHGDQCCRIHDEANVALLLLESLDEE